MNSDEIQTAIELMREAMNSELFDAKKYELDLQVFASIINKKKNKQKKVNITDSTSESSEIPDDSITAENVVIPSSLYNENNTENINTDHTNINTDHININKMNEYDQILENF